MRVSLDMELYWKLRLTKRRKHARRNGVTEDTSKIIHKPADDNSLISQSPRRRFCYNRITSRSNGDHITECRDDKQDSNCQLDTVARGKTKTANGNEAEEHEC